MWRMILQKPFPPRFFFISLSFPLLYPGPYRTVVTASFRRHILSNFGYVNIDLLATADARVECTHLLCFSFFGLCCQCRHWF